MATMQCLLRANGDDEFAGEKAHRWEWTKRGLGHGLPYGLPYGLPVVDF